MKYGLPIDTFRIRDVWRDDIVDMSDLNFGDDVQDKQRAALLFVRNTGIDTNFVFDNCSFEDKEHYLMLYLTARRLDVDIPILASTWVRILLHNQFESHVESILTEDEIDIIYKKNTDLINEIYRFLISIPLCAMATYKDRDFDLSGFEMYEYDGFNPFTFAKIFQYKEIVMLSQQISGIEPVYYINYFRTNNAYPYFIRDIMDPFPYLALLTIIEKNDDELTDNFIKGLQKLLCKSDE